MGASYYGALGARREFLARDLAQLQRHGINWIRVWVTWSAFGADVSAVDDEGRPREPYFGKLRWLLTEAAKRGMVVDLTLTRGERRLGRAHLSKPGAHERAVETLADSLRSWRNWYLDLANEHNIRPHKYVSVQQARRLRDLVKQVDPDRLVTISFVGDLSKAHLSRYLFEIQVDFLAPHRWRRPTSPAQTERVTRRYLEWMDQLGRVVPVHYQEPFRLDFSRGWQPMVADFLRDLAGAVRGGAAGWCFHNGDNRWAEGGHPRRSFDVRSKNLFDQLAPVERAVLRHLSSVAAHAAATGSAPCAAR